jgi:biotin/methionine sulfoxide reductase
VTSKVVRNHSHWGAFLAEVKDGRIVGVRPFERDPDPSTLIGAIPTAVHSTTRIDQPMVREGWLARGQGNGEGRGREGFLPVPWERALDLVAAELARIKASHGHGDHGWVAGLGIGRDLS